MLSKLIRKKNMPNDFAQMQSKKKQSKGLNNSQRKQTMKYCK